MTNPIETIPLSNFLWKQIEVKDRQAKRLANEQRLIDSKRQKLISQWVKALIEEATEKHFP